jgi:hypothetical protein
MRNEHCIYVAWRGTIIGHWYGKRDYHLKPAVRYVLWWIPGGGSLAWFIIMVFQVDVDTYGKIYHVHPRAPVKHERFTHRCKILPSHCESICLLNFYLPRLHVDFFLASVYITIYQFKWNYVMTCFIKKHNYSHIFSVTDHNFLHDVHPLILQKILQSLKSRVSHWYMIWWVSDIIFPIKSVQEVNLPPKKCHNRLTQLCYKPNIFNSLVTNCNTLLQFHAQHD